MENLSTSFPSRQSTIFWSATLTSKLTSEGSPSPASHTRQKKTDQNPRNNARVAKKAGFLRALILGGMLTRCLANGFARQLARLAPERGWLMW